MLQWAFEVKGKPHQVPDFPALRFSPPPSSFPSSPPFPASASASHCQRQRCYPAGTYCQYLSRFILPFHSFNFSTLWDQANLKKSSSLHWSDFHCYRPVWILCEPCDRSSRSSWSRSRCRPWGRGGARWCRQWRGRRSRRSSIPLLHHSSSFPPPLLASPSTELPGSTSVPQGQCPWRKRLMFYSTSGCKQQRVLWDKPAKSFFQLLSCCSVRVKGMEKAKNSEAEIVLDILAQKQ